MNKIILFLLILIIILVSVFFLRRFFTSRDESFSFKELQKEERNENPSIKTKFFESEGHVRIAYYPYISKDEKANFILIHGGGAHSNAGYQSIAEELSEQYKTSVYLMDLRGHGLSGDRRGDAQEVEFVFKDIQNLIKLIKSRSNKPIFLGGHSSGCGVILNYITYLNSDNIEGFIFISPEFGYKANIKRENIKEPFARARIWVFVLSALSGKKLFNHTKAVFFNYPKEILDMDKLIFNFYTTNMARACTPENPEELFKKIDKPVQMIIGENDELIDPDKLRRFLPLLNNKIKIRSDYKIIKNASHLSVLLHCEPVIGETILNWINK